ncbi:MAG: hypothetical protein COV74_02520 [Candidatus Omnitrophica bacterium CG11_big_fil_rev_8_21_14_0_20_45_26]|uniref:Cytochrome oxidase assembly protein n=1 Tax=Candidatus Abzuiibacterium crystallinum TaxID=1974748 RepID=A0A2H0LRN8_9BACT|nr:MAG: hypothetical protein COV74_02520 [Candidatus Omnitrophica bacterium CG11_big_fil_rev_8_21_14_0_20_45_26]PIW65710.1 MAG: hypothetical protein COW12_00365 [Candidatus Omnitrophica bacterium CG12_big_fil_rev_8_21_14_0_65_45_16]
MNIWLRRYTKILTGLTFGLVIAGGLVTSTGSGLAVPDWPLSYGQLMPPMVGGIRFEHSHRLIASLIGFMTLLLTFWIGWREKRRWMRWMSIGALGMVVFQGILGGMTVLFLLPAPLSIFHGCLAQTFFAWLVVLAYGQSKEWQSKEMIRTGVTALKQFLLIAFGFVYAQLVLGAAIRHTHNHLLLIPHLIGALIVLVLAIAILVHVLRHHSAESRLTKPAIFLFALVIAQLLLGMGSFVYTVVFPKSDLPASLSQVFFVTGHQSLGALILAACVFLTARVFRLDPHAGHEKIATGLLRPSGAP